MAARTGGIFDYCWDRNPNKAGRCVLNAGHKGNHCDWYARRSSSPPTRGRSASAPRGH
ncbi:hypothetical protein [Streptomyces poriferorum]|uniref:Uncharacterized protein n=1 Tax=Streptomyces poriferorum TaxID=2798799 RepID=A0ABY9J588_9ACTN|nr:MULTISPECIES: hypothetical protein [unclassified Streptomyces]MDP5309407.1 hypothetical protein [Streptomyces sp. Alt4]WLQ61393.1 hypothetical protein P8A19_40965 [Streptomyces sp. Alt2]